MKKLSILLLILLSIPLNIFSNTTDNLMKKLDESLANREYYIDQKEDKLNLLKADLAQIPKENTLDRYEITKQLMNEYSYFISDSALFYSAQCLDLAEELNNSELILDIQLTRALLLCYPELFHEAFNILENIDPDILSDNQKANYYYTYLFVLHLQIKDLNSPYYRAKYRSEVIKYLDKYFSVATDTQTYYFFVLAYRYYQKGDLDSAVEILQKILNNPNISPYTHATIMFYLGIAYMEMRGEEENAETTLIKASIKYNELAIMRNLALSYLATILNKNNDVNRAYNYINVAMDDYRKFSDNKNYSVTQKNYSAVQNAYYAKIKKQQSALQMYLIMLSASFIILIITIFYILKHNKELRKIRTQLYQTNKNLKDSNYVKEIYIGHYLNQCSLYIDKLDEYKKLIVKKLKENKSGESKTNEISLAFDTKSDINKLLLDFDKTFLDLHPNFIKNINNLLTEENYYSLKSNDNNRPRLNAEIRILALLKLGITDNKKIASFLRFTVQTVYNYRSKAKSRAINEETFEDDIKKINT